MIDNKSTLRDVDVLRHKLLNCEELFHVEGTIDTLGDSGYIIKTYSGTENLTILFSRKEMPEPHYIVTLLTRGVSVPTICVDIESTFTFIKDVLLENNPPDA